MNRNKFWSCWNYFRASEGVFYVVLACWSYFKLFWSSFNYHCAVEVILYCFNLLDLFLNYYGSARAI